jgi:soluble lytic murein transglycosylase-like protein
MAGLRRVLAAACMFSVQVSVAAAETNVCEREMVRAAAMHQVPLGMLYAVGLTETGRAGSLQPYALNVDGRPEYEDSKASALRTFRKARKAGAKRIDVGCMQINHYYHGEKFGSLEDMFDPAQNVAYAARFLRELKEREGSWTMAVARYHAGPTNFAAQKTYVCRVISNLVATGFGAQTAESRAYCGR